MVDKLHELLVQLLQGQWEVVQYDMTSTILMKRGFQLLGWHQDGTSMMSMRMTVRLPAARTIANMMRREDQWASWIDSAALTVTVGSYTIRCNATSMISMRMAVRLLVVRKIANVMQREDQWASWNASAVLTGTVGSCTIQYHAMSTMSMRMVVRLPAARMIPNMMQQQDQWASWIVSTALTGTEWSHTIRRDEYDGDEKRIPAAWMTSSKMRWVRYWWGRQWGWYRQHGW